MRNTTSGPGGDGATAGDQGDARAQHADEPPTPRSDAAGAGGQGQSRPLMPRLVAVLAVMAVLASGWVVLQLSRSAQDDTLARRAESSGPISEYPPDLRGDPVQLAGTTLTDTPLDVVDLRGHLVVINVWGSWCVPCREEAPVLARLSREYAERGVRFVGVNVKDNRGAALAFEERYRIPYPSIEDRDGSALLVLSRHAPAHAVPFTLVLDADGRVAARVIGLVREATLRALLDGALGEDLA